MHPIQSQSLLGKLSFLAILTAGFAVQPSARAGTLIDSPLWGNAPVETAITMPATAPYYPALAFPAQLEGDITLIWFKTTRETIAGLLPPNAMYLAPLAFVDGQVIKPFGDDYVMTLILVDYVDSTYGAYREVVFGISCMTADPDPSVLPPTTDPTEWQWHYDLGAWHAGLYLPYLWLSSDGPVAAGREIWGFPKKMAEIIYKDKNGRRNWEVQRGGDTTPILHKDSVRESIIEAWIEPDPQNVRHPDEVKLPPALVMKIIPNVDGITSDVRQLNLVPVDPQYSEGTILWGRAGLTLRGSPSDPLNDIEVVSVYGGYQFRHVFHLGSGRTLKDFLRE